MVGELEVPSTCQPPATNLAGNALEMAFIEVRHPTDAHASNHFHRFIFPAMKPATIRKYYQICIKIIITTKGI